jgi:hypothetical protein
MLRKGLILAGSLLVFVGILFLAVGDMVKLFGGGFVLVGIVVFIVGVMRQRSPAQ